MIATLTPFVTSITRVALDSLVDANTVILFCLGLLALLVGSLFLIMRSIETRAWVWLALGTLAIAPVLVTALWSVAAIFFDAGNAIVKLGALEVAIYAQMGAIVLTLAFGFFGPRRLSRLMTPEQRQRPMRWIAGVCASIAGLLLTLNIVTNSMDAARLPDQLAVILPVSLVCIILAATTGLVAAVGSGVRRLRWRWLAALLASALSVAGLWVYAFSAASGDNGPIAYILGAVISMCALALFALRGDRGLRARSATQPAALHIRWQRQSRQR
jgi:hypothetical protein